MSLTSLLYVSRSNIRPDQAEATVAEIVSKSCDRNPTLAITGALLFTGTHFVQVLEGSAAVLDPLLVMICSDPRHTQLIVSERGLIQARRFGDWRMAYFGPSQFISRHVERLLNDPAPVEKRRAAGWVNDLLFELSVQDSVLSP